MVPGFANRPGRDTAMRRYLLTIAVLLAAQGAAQAQVMIPPRSGPFQRQAPALSPYLNLVRGGNPAVNYYLGVLTEFDRRSFEAQVLAQPELVFQQAPADPEDLIPRLTQTGHNVAFQYY